MGNKNAIYAVFENRFFESFKLKGNPSPPSQKKKEKPSNVEFDRDGDCALTKTIVARKHAHCDVDRLFFFPFFFSLAVLWANFQTAYYANNVGEFLKKEEEKTSAEVKKYLPRMLMFIVLQPA